MSCRTPLLLFNVSAVTIAISLSIAACNAQAALSDMSRIFRQTPSLEAFEICFGGGCAEVKQVALNNEEWQKVVHLFALNAALNAAQERERIAEAIGLLEVIVGEKIGTSNDIAGTFYTGNLVGQLDCNDEAINTTTYMRLMRQTGLIKWHEVEDTRTRSFFFNGWPHSTAVMHDVQTGERFAVDSWFYDNGAPATIVPFAIWKSGYRPADSPIGQPRASKTNTPAR
jgi:hypothetical protein